METIHLLTTRYSLSRLRSVVLRLVVGICAACAIPAIAQSIPGFGIVMTYNVNEGTDFLQVQGG